MDDEGHSLDLKTKGIFDESRLLGEIPHYESLHARHYFSDQSQFRSNQWLPREERTVKRQLEGRLREQLAGLGQSDRVELVSGALPELKDSMEDLRQTSVKYNVLINRLSGRTHHVQQVQSNFAQVPPEVMAKFGFQIKEILHTDIFSNHIKLPDDIQISKSHHMSSLIGGSPGTNDLLHMNQLHKNSGDNLPGLMRTSGGHLGLDN